MHGSVLQNEEYIKFSDASTVEVISLSRLEEGISKNDPKAAEYDAKDDSGAPVKRMLSYPNLTKDEMLALNRSKAGTYNNTGKIPFTCIVNPHDEAEMQRFQGGQSSKTIMEAVAVQQKVLNGKFGPNLSRPVVREFRADSATVLDAMPKTGAGKALTEHRKIVKALGKEAAAMKPLTDKVEATILEAATKELDDAEAKLSEGDAAGAKKILGKLVSALKGTELEARGKELVEKSKAVPADAAK